MIQELDVLLLSSKTDRRLAAELENDFKDYSLSVKRVEPTQSTPIDSIPVDEATCVVLVLTKKSGSNRRLMSLALKAVKQRKLFPILMDGSAIPFELQSVQIARDMAEEGMHVLMRSVLKATGKNHLLIPSLREHNKSASELYIKVDGIAYQYQGSGTTEWLNSQNFQRERQRLRQEYEASLTAPPKVIVKESSSTPVIHRHRTTKKGIVFISYSRKDQRVADRLDSLFRILNVPAWWDDQLSPGEDWETQLRERLKVADCVLVIWSKDSVQSEWVLVEAQQGFKEKKLLGLRVDDCTIPQPYSGSEIFTLVAPLHEMVLNDRSTRDFLRRIDYYLGLSTIGHFETEAHDSIARIN